MRRVQVDPRTTTGTRREMNKGARRKQSKLQWAEQNEARTANLDRAQALMRAYRRVVEDGDPTERPLDAVGGERRIHMFPKAR